MCRVKKFAGEIPAREKENAFCQLLSPLLFDVGRSAFDVER